MQGAELKGTKRERRQSEGTRHVLGAELKGTKLIEYFQKLDPSGVLEPTLMAATEDDGWETLSESGGEDISGSIHDGSLPNSSPGWHGGYQHVSTLKTQYSCARACVRACRSYANALVDPTRQPHVVALLRVCFQPLHFFFSSSFLYLSLRRHLGN